MSVSLKQILSLVGKLDDSPGSDTPRERFREFMKSNISDIGQIRDYIQECLRDSGNQYNRALQDLINYTGHFLGFDVVFGRYQGVPHQIGFDGHWKSSETNFHIVVEVKTTEVYAIKTATLMGYIHELISEGEIPSIDHTIGLYVIGRPDPEIRQLRNAIIAENKMNQLRIVSVESLLLLAEMMSQYDVKHEDILSLLRPSGPSIDPLVDLMSRLVISYEIEEQKTVEPPAGLSAEEKIVYWITPVKNHEEETAEECILKLVGKEKIYAFGEKTPGRKSLGPGHWICFYAAGNGVIAHAKVASHPEKKVHPSIHHPEEYPWTFRLEDAKVYPDNPVILTASLRSELDAFKGRDLNKAWSWFVQGTRKITEHDFLILTRKIE